MSLENQGAKGWVGAGWSQGEVCGLPSKFSEHCQIHKPDGELRLCQGLMEGSRESG